MKKKKKENVERNMREDDEQKLKENQGKIVKQWKISF